MKTITNQSVSSADVYHLEGISSSQTLSATHSCSTVQTFEMVSTVKTSTTSVKSFQVQQHTTTSDEFPKRPTLTLKMNDIIVSLGDMAQFSCAFDGEPLIETVWDHDGETLLNTERVQCMDIGGILSLIILNVQLADKGNYRCTVKNHSGENQTSAWLTVEGASSFFFFFYCHLTPCCLKAYM